MPLDMSPLLGSLLVSRFDHIFGMYVTLTGRRVRRLDLILVPRRYDLPRLWRFRGDEMHL